MVGRVALNAAAICSTVYCLESYMAWAWRTAASVGVGLRPPLRPHAPAASRKRPRQVANRPKSVVHRTIGPGEHPVELRRSERLADVTGPRWSAEEVPAMDENGGLSQDRAAYKLIENLFERYGETFEGMQWPWEESRWQRLVYNLLAGVSGEWGSSSKAARATEVLVNLDLIRLSGLAKADDSMRRDIETVLRRVRFSAEAIGEVVPALVRIARFVAEEYRGRIQRLLREAGSNVIREMNDRLPLRAELGDERAELVVTHWLQDVLNLPVLVSSPGLSRFAAETGLDLAAIEDEFDEYGLNVALADEMLGRWLLEQTGPDEAGVAS